jgi:hypothetical protein
MNAVQLPDVNRVSPKSRVVIVPRRQLLDPSETFGRKARAWDSHIDVSLRSLTWPHIPRKFTR